MTQHKSLLDGGIKSTIVEANRKGTHQQTKEEEMNDTHILTKDKINGIHSLTKEEMNGTYNLTKEETKDIQLLVKAEKTDRQHLELVAEAEGLLHEKEDFNDTKCGLGPCTPNWLQCLATKESYMLVYCLVGLIQGMFFTYTVSVISTIEKRFKLTSKMTGAMLSGNDISQVILSMILSYYGNYGHRPRWLGIGVMFAALSCFLASIPHALYGPGEDAIDVAHGASREVGLLANASGIISPRKKQELCFSHLEENCDEDSQTTTASYLGPVILLFISQFFVGIAISIFYSIGLTYLDDNISKRTTPFYYSLTLMLRILGPVLGFFLGGKCLSTWIDPTKKPNLSIRDPRWFGAWWLGYIFLGVGLFISGGLLFFFPRKLPATLKRETKKVVRQAKKDEVEGGGRGVEYFASLAKTKKTEAKPSIKNLKKALKRLFTNKIWVGNLFNTVIFILAIAGYWNFKPKYLENQFRKSASEANFYTGMASLVASLLGTGISGAILRWIRPGPRLVTGYNIFITLFGCATYIALMFIGCPKLDVIGPIGESGVPSCSADCGCSDKFSPVCAEDGTTLFYSPCYAGCSGANSSASPVMYSDCRCIANTTLPLMDPPHLHSIASSQDSEDLWGSATRGYCPEPCTSFVYYIVLQIITKTIYSTGRVGSSIVNLRCVADEDKGLALGTLMVFVSLFGFIPAPMIMGAIIDSACLVWEKSCGVFGNCWLYDSDKFRMIIHLVPAVFVFISVLGDIVVYYYSSKLDLYGDNEDDIELEKPPPHEELTPMNPQLEKTDPEKGESSTDA